MERELYKLMIVINFSNSEYYAEVEVFRHFRQLISDPYDS
jgi:hypothetical protein